jgi:hypothetical protein
MEFTTQPPREVAHHINGALEGVSNGQFEKLQKRTGETDK